MKILEEDNETKSQRTIVEAVKYLKNYTMEHFSDEEAYQRAIGYEGFDGHHREHEKFAQIVLEQEKILKKNGYTSSDVKQFVEIVNGWLVGHIMHCDQEIAPGE